MLWVNSYRNILRSSRLFMFRNEKGDLWCASLGALSRSIWWFIIGLCGVWLSYEPI